MNISLLFYSSAVCLWIHLFWTGSAVQKSVSGSDLIKTMFNFFSCKNDLLFTMIILLPCAHYSCVFTKKVISYKKNMIFLQFDCLIEVITILFLLSRSGSTYPEPRIQIKTKWIQIHYTTAFLNTICKEFLIHAFEVSQVSPFF